MWYELKALALANHNNYVIHLQTLCRSIRWDHISLAGFLERGNNIFLCRGIALAVHSRSGSKMRRRRGVGAWRSRWHMWKACRLHRGRSRWVLPGSLLRVVCGGREGLAPPLFMGASRVKQHLLWQHQHPLTPVWQFHSCGVTIGADGFVSASTPFLPCNWMSPRPLLWPGLSLVQSGLLQAKFTQSIRPNLN